MSNKDWASRNSNEYRPKEFRIEVPELNLYNMNAGITGKWTAPIGWNRYQATGNFKWCRPIINPCARINTQAFEPINFEMV